MPHTDRRSFLKQSSALGALAFGGSAFARGDGPVAALAADNKSDTIADIELFRLRTIRMRSTAPYFLLVRIRTKNGLTGWGECYTVETSERWTKQYIESLKGRNLSGLINRFYLEGLKDHDPERPTRENMGWCSGISCLEIALWDILGKQANQPVHALLGGAVRDKIPLYANHAVFKGEGPAELDRILRMKELGFDMFKWDPFKGAPEDEKTIQQQLKLVRQAREALGPDFKIAIDAHRRWKNLKGPMLAAKAMEPLDIAFFEEPVHHRQAEVFAELAEHTSIPLASGELMTHHHEVRDLLKGGALTYLQPDVGNFGGIAATRNACQYADTHGVGISTHNWSGPISTLAAIQYTAVIPNLFRQEWPHVGYGQQWETEIVSPQLVAKDSHVNISQQPGIGAIPDMEALKKLRV